MRTTERLPLWAWLLPVAAATAAVAVSTIRGNTVDGTMAGAVLIALSGLLVFALCLEALPPARGWIGTIRRSAIAVALGVAAGALSFLAAGLGYYLVYRPFG